MLLAGAARETIPVSCWAPTASALTAEDTVYLTDGRNHRVQKFARDGTYLSQGFGSFGDGDGQFNSPWGFTLDGDGYLYIADTKNDRVQKLTTDGEFVAQFGAHGTGQGPAEPTRRRGGGPGWRCLRGGLGQ